MLGFSSHQMCSRWMAVEGTKGYVPFCRRPRLIAGETYLEGGVDCFCSPESIVLTERIHGSRECAHSDAKSPIGLDLCNHGRCKTHVDRNQSLAPRSRSMRLETFVPRCSIVHQLRVRAFGRSPIPIKSQPLARHTVPWLRKYCSCMADMSATRSGPWSCKSVQRGSQPTPWGI